SRVDRPVMRTVAKEPALVRRILDGMYDNVVSHAGWAEIVPFITLHWLFRLAFYASYAVEQSPKALWQLLQTTRDARSPAVARSHSVPRAFSLARFVAVGRRSPLPWARRRGTEVLTDSSDGASSKPSTVI